MQLIDRAIKVLGCTDDTGLAKKIGKDKSTISKWRTSGTIPAKAERELLELMGGCLQDVIDDNVVTIPLDVTEGYTFFNMEKLRAIIERIAEFILTNAGLPYRPYCIRSPVNRTGGPDHRYCFLARAE